MVTSKASGSHSVRFQLDRIVPKAPLGVLGNFIQCKVRLYAEPSREGTPKGQAVGLSQQKYRAALLSYLTAVDLKRIAREVGASYPLLLKWRTEDSFDKAGYDAAVEFIDGRGRFDGEFDNAARQVLRLVCRIGDTVTPLSGGEALAKKIEKEEFFGFDDAGLYGTWLLSMIQDRHVERVHALLKTLTNLEPNQKPADKAFDMAGDVVGWAYCIDRIERVRAGLAKKSELQSFTQRRQHAQSLLNLLITGALSRRPVDPSVQDIALYTSVILGKLLKE